MNFLFLKVILLSIAPISELRGAIPIAISAGWDPLLAFLISSFANISVFFIVFIFLNYLHKYLLKSSYYERLFLRYLDRKRKDLEKHVNTNWEFLFLFLFLFVAVPFPLTGAYSGSLLAWIFNLEKKKAFLAISLGVFTAGAIVTLVSIGFINLFDF